MCFCLMCRLCVCCLDNVFTNYLNARNRNCNKLKFYYKLTKNNNNKVIQQTGKLKLKLKYL